MVFSLLRGSIGPTLGAPNTGGGGSWAPTTLTATVDGSPATLTQVDAITTRSGIWWVDSLGQFGDSHVYSMRFSGNSAFIRLLVMRRVFTVEAGDGTALNMRAMSLSATLNGTPYSWSVKCSQGSVRVVQNQQPIAPSPSWIREAVQNHRVPAFDRKYAAIQSALTPYSSTSSAHSWRGAYDPESLGPNQTATTPTSNSNYVGVTSAQGGEYTSSRGFIHDVDAGVIDRALNNEDTPILTAWNQFVQFTFYSLAQPQGGVWSTALHTSVDSQIPQSGETAWEIAGATPYYSNVNSLQPADNWGRDASHLENTGFVHWIATEDPIAGLLLIRQLSWSLGSYFEYKRPGGVLTEYKVETGQERCLLNSMSALWKAKDVISRTSTLHGRFIWESARINKQVSDCIAYLDTTEVQPMITATDVTSDNYARKLASYPFGSGSIYQSTLTPSGGSSTSIRSFVQFHLNTYGPPALYLFAKSGNITVKTWLEYAARHTVARIVTIGGARGNDGISRQTALGNDYPIKFTGVNPTWTDLQGWCDWILSMTNTTYFNGTTTMPIPRTNFGSSWTHTSNTLYGLLLLARDAGVTGLDSSITAVRSMLDTTTDFRDGGVNQSHKVCFGPYV